MASIQKRGESWRAFVLVDGKRESKTFTRKAEAVAWAQARESALIQPDLPGHTVRDALRRFARDVAPTHKGEQWEVARCRLLERHPIAGLRLDKLTASDIADWRDQRLKEVKPASVRREMGMFRSVLEIARKEWGWLRENPARDVKRPPSPASRKRRVSDEEIQTMMLALGYDGGVPTTAEQRIALAFDLAIQTAMRSGEICGLTWARVREKAVSLPETKNGDARDVPLNRRAREIIGLLPRESESVFQLDAGTRDTLFRRARDRTPIVDLHFHDSRAEAIWRLSKKVDVMELARIIGHRDLKSLLIYYRTSADELADRLD